MRLGLKSSEPAGSAEAGPVEGRPAVPPPVPVEPIPWATGLTASVMVAALTTAIVILVSQALRGAYGWLWIPANLALAIGIGPALWLMRAQPFWRWIVHGVAAGFGLAWISLVIGVVFRVRGG
jgi:VIT1/CCC1 family predicted Fe2+/Mn2+ transporter